MRDNLFSDLNIQLGAHCPLPIVSTNGYYGYQPVRNQPDNKADEHHNQMEVDSNSFSENANITDSNSNAQLFNRKRLSSEPIEVHAFKKRRQNENLPHTHFQNKEIVTFMENIKEEELLESTHGSCLHHWNRESDL
ncbi:uncharacterized protein LOC123309065 isoform X1 [Coccinella septempunctata]|uniref:uncharacterized protein LOC123309065 isoform X1 n=1 Tax=Coccinella septempunctata TaxID=41139 RepID=UPI001D091E6C|nr:uncharacterized protein LOC123309065 isoform X1 [Coccinella septempunctata]